VKLKETPSFRGVFLFPKETCYNIIKSNWLKSNFLIYTKEEDIMTESNHIVTKSFLSAGPILLALVGAHHVANADTTITIKSGDTLSALANTHNSTVSTLTRTNNIQNPDLIFAGNTLVVPDAPTQATQDTSNLTTYTVQAGDSLSIIADRFGTSAQDIAKNSGIDMYDIIRPGQVLQLKAAVQSTPVQPATDSQSDTPQVSTPESTESTSQAQQSTAAPSQESSTSAVAQPSTPDSTSTSAVQQPVESQSVQTQTSTASSTSQSSVQQADSTASSQTDVQSASTVAQPVSDQSASATDTTPVSTTTSTTATNDNTQSQVSQASPAEQANQSTTTATPVSDNTGNSTTTATSTPAQQTDGDWRSLAESFIGTPYVWGGKTPSTGFDCSGFVAWVLNHSGRTTNFPSYTVAEESQVQQIPVSEAQPGDLLFWGDHGATYHVAIYLGNGQFISAPEPGDHVRIQTLSRGWSPSFAGRV
jgi:peptidoglycan DL-endopeptidase CwlO